MALSSGMDVGQITGLAGEFRGRSAELDSVRRSVDAAVQRAAGVWDGDDMRRFRALWEQGLRTRMVGLVDELDRLAGVLQSNASAQEKASAAGGAGAGASGGAAGVGIGGGGGGVWDPGTGGAGAGPGTPGSIDDVRSTLRGADSLLDAELLGPYSARDALGHIPGLGDVLGAEKLLGTMMSPEASLWDKGAAGADAVSGALMESPVPVIRLAGQAASIWTFDARLIAETDWSAETFHTSVDFVVEHPGEALAAAGQGVVDGALSAVETITPSSVSGLVSDAHKGVGWLMSTVGP